MLHIACPTLHGEGEERRERRGGREGGRGGEGGVQRKNDSKYHTSVHNMHRPISFCELQLNFIATYNQPGGHAGRDD